MILIEVAKSLRPLQWLKNFFIFAPLIFSENILNLPLFLQACAAFVVFCLLSGSLYIFNDIRDIEEDKLHPVKSKRPLAAGKIKKGQAVFAFVVLSAAAFFFAYLLNEYFFAAVIVYFVLQFAYSLWLKHVTILDVFIIASGFFIRVIAGGFAIEVYISSWLLICTIFLALFIALCKRRHELVLLDTKADEHRSTLKDYSPYLLDQMIAVVTASTVIAYCLYTVSDETVVKFGTTNLIFTVPFVLYGIFRYLFLVHQRFKGGSPETLILKDRPLLFDVVLWIASAVLIIYL
jgi:4-hydroxybenzoate polyprenyltransferase